MTSSTLLMRQIHPNFIQNGRPTTQAFRPTPKDESRLSVYDGDQIQPQPAWGHYTDVLGLVSAGVMGIAAQECSSLSLPVSPDPESFTEHCVIDFSGLTKSDVGKKAKLLADFATARDWLFKAPARQPT